MIAAPAAGVLPAGLVSWNLLAWSGLRPGEPSPGYPRPLRRNQAVVAVEPATPRISIGVRLLAEPAVIGGWPSLGLHQAVPIALAGEARTAPASLRRSRARSILM